MARVTFRKGLDEVRVEAATIAKARDNTLVQALGIPENPAYFVDGVEVDASYALDEGDIVRIEAKASDKGC